MGNPKKGGSLRLFIRLLLLQKLRSALAALGIFSSLLLSFGTLAIMVFPGLGAVGMSYMMPMGLYEVGLGFWLLIKGIKAPTAQ